MWNRIDRKMKICLNDIFDVEGKDELLFSDVRRKWESNEWGLESVNEFDKLYRGINSPSPHTTYQLHFVFHHSIHLSSLHLYPFQITSQHTHSTSYKNNNKQIHSSLIPSSNH